MQDSKYVNFIIKNQTKKNYSKSLTKTISNKNPNFQFLLQKTPLTHVTITQNFITKKPFKTCNCHKNLFATKNSLLITSNKSTIPFHSKQASEKR